ncbi:MAG: hypothetical protein ACJ8D6_08120 [Sphingomicrobium sp.]
MTRLFLAAGVAALAISMPASAKPGGGHGGGDKQSAQTQSRGGGGHGGNVQARGGGGGGGKAFRMESRGGGGGHAFRMESRGGGRQAFQQRSFQRQNGGHAQRQSFAFQDRGHGRGKASVRMDRGNARATFADRHQNRGSMKAQRFEQRQVRNIERQHGNRFEQRQARNFERQRGFDRIQNRDAFRNDFRGDRLAVRDVNVRDVRGVGLGGCPPGLMSKGCMPPGQALQASRIASAEAFRESRLAALAFNDSRTRFLDPFEATRFIGAPYSTVNGIVPLMAFPASVSYLYPDTPDYYYRYGNGYLYEVDRDTSLIAALLPLLGGGILPGQYLPNAYMSSYVPNYYGFNSFYPSSYAGYGYGYDNLCNRYANGVIYQVDCATGFVEDVIPMYAGGYGVGQMLPSGYGYYNVPTQYRSLYYDTSAANYWYAPGAIYQYDPSSSLITSVAALLSPGFSVGQPLPMGYDVYNVPYGYRNTYFDTPSAMYRYNNGNIYQVDPTTMLVTAIVASILT